MKTEKIKISPDLILADMGNGCRATLHHGIVIYRVSKIITYRAYRSPSNPRYCAMPVITKTMNPGMLAIVWWNVPDACTQCMHYASLVSI